MKKQTAAIMYLGLVGGNSRDWARYADGRNTRAQRGEPAPEKYPGQRRAYLKGAYRPAAKPAAV